MGRLRKFIEILMTPNYKFYEDKPITIEYAFYIGMLIGGVWGAILGTIIMVLVS